MHTPPQLEAARAALPNFSKVDPEALREQITALIKDSEAALHTLLNKDTPATWDALFAPLEAINDRLNKAWAPVRHLHGVADTDALRQAYNDVLPEVVRYGSAQLQHDGLHAAFQRFAASAGFAAERPARQQVVQQALRDFRLGGIALDGERRARFLELQQRLNQLGTSFQEHVLDATRAFSIHLTDEARLAGWPAHLRQLAAQNASLKGVDGWVLTLDGPCYQAVMMYAEDRALRAEIYQAYCTRASNEGPQAGRFDNGPLIDDILKCRHELATLLGFANYAEYSLATKMAPSVPAVLEFLTELAARSLPHAEQEMAELVAFARNTLGLARLEAWDIAFASERLRLHAFDISQEALRPYFPVERVTAGLFAMLNRLFGLRVEPLADVDRWHDDVACYAIFDRSSSLRGLFYLDLFARPGKQGGAWMDECLVRRQTGNGLQHPAAFLTCNFTPPVAGQPSLLTHDEVITLFHEFGHGLHHLLTLVDEAAVSGINGVPWDAVELPSQFMENFCWEEAALDLLAAHHDTGEGLPSALFERLLAAKNFQSGMKMLRQIEFALFDFRLHAADPATLDVQALLDEVRQTVAVVKVPAWNRFQHGFTHIFGGGYAAGYYSYKWAEVLAADAFGRFEEAGVFDPQAGQDFLQHILEAGGATDAMQLFRRFRGRDPAPDALLRRSGLAS